jgi:radical SAM superfamily enzyme YgiQ (UPF0313 family)
MDKKTIIIVGLYLPGIYPKGDDSVATDLLAPAVLKATADADAEISRSYEIKILSLPVTIDSEELAKKICDENPFVVGYSVYIWNYYSIIENSKHVKKILPETKIIFGGPQVTYMPVDVLKENPQVDIVVYGSGESKFKLLLKGGLMPEGLSKIPSIVYRNEAGKAVSTEGDIHEDMSQIPSPYQTKAINLNDGLRHTVLLETFRSCPFKCGYCAWGKEKERKIQPFPIEQILEDIELIYNNPRVEAVIVTDACIYYQPRERVKKIIDKIASCRKIPTIVTLDIHLLDEELIRYLSKIELGDVWCFGMQSINPLAIKLMGRKTDKETFINKTKLLREIVPSAEISFNIIYGLPGDNYETFRETIDFALTLKPIKLQIYPLVLLPGSPFWYKEAELGFVYDDSPPYMVRSNKHYSAEDMEETFRFSLWYLSITYFPAIRDAILNIPDYNHKFRHIDLIDMFIENMKRRVDPITDLRTESIKTIELFNLTRRKVFNFLFEPENCLHAYESTLELLKRCNVEDIFTAILIGIDYYKSLNGGFSEQDEAFFVEKYGREKIRYIKNTWVRPFRTLSKNKNIPDEALNSI